MPDQIEYNPYIMGFTGDRGPVFIPLQDARDKYGKLPSDFGFVSAKQTRQKKKVLNLGIGKVIVNLLADPNHNLKDTVFQFFSNWHRDLASEFGLHMSPFWNLSQPRQVIEILRNNRIQLSRYADLDLREFLMDRFIRKDVLNSIDDPSLPDTANQIIMKKIKTSGSLDTKEKLRKANDVILAYRVLRRITDQTGLDFSHPNDGVVNVFADDIAALLPIVKLDSPLSGIERLFPQQNEPVAFSYATRDATYLELGKKTGDCTSDKSPFQTNREIENIYWTVFPWILDRNYQILKVFYRNAFVLKAHLVPLFIEQGGDGFMALAVDAIETVRAFRDDLGDQGHQEMLKERHNIFECVINKILKIAGEMGIDRVYAEKFSNTPWVREAFATYPEIFLRVDQIIKIDDLEDIYCLSQELCRGHNQSPPQEVFMEIQMKNIFLQPTASKKAQFIKSYAILKGDPKEGIPIKRVFGI